MPNWMPSNSVAGTQRLARGGLGTRAATVSGDSFIGQGSDEPGTAPERRDLYLSTYKDEPAVPVADYDFIAHARQDVPRLLAEVRRLRGESALE